MKIEYFCFVAAAAAALTGMSVGLYMGLAHDFTLAPAHAHLNLLGWVTMSLYGLYHRGRDKRPAALAWTQVGTGVVGFIGMSGGLAVTLTIGGPVALGVTLAGAAMAILSMTLFMAVVIGDGLLSGRDARLSGVRRVGEITAFGEGTSFTRS
ncbi:hypothetical protein [Skermanella stibiiresistens]|uniref:hypothetical protein n=1 Tax=Skermanella stibiiresistens TaxID=913326 RepID=UPI0004BBA028|nr:hypothetical protein [Skermanella stibiiresistens]